MLRKIDIHTHILPPKLPSFREKFGYGGFIQLDHHQPCRAKMVKDTGEVFREIESNCWDPQVRQKECDASEVDIQVLSTVPVMFSYWAKPQDGLDLSRFLNDHLIEVCGGSSLIEGRATTPKRFVGLATLPMQAPQLAAKELQRCVQAGLVGAEIGSHINEWNLDDPELFPVYEAAESLGACLLIHPWDMMSASRMPKYWLPWLVGMPAEVSLAICSLIFGGIFDRFPRLRVAFAHGGGAFSGAIGRIEQGYRSRPDLCAINGASSPRSYLGKFFVDSLVHDSTVLGSIVDLYGEDSVLLGSDYPFPLGEELPGKLIESLSVDREIKEKLRWKNALKWLGKTSEQLGYP